MTPNFPVSHTTETSASLVCPSCQGDLERGAEKLTCSKCRTTWPVEAGVPRFVAGNDNYWGEAGISKEIADDLLRRMETEDWKLVFAHHESPAVREHFAFISDLKRADWYKCLDLPDVSTVLDIGAGTGAISQALSQKYAKVYAVERVQQRVEFMRHRFRQERVQGVELIQADLDTLPFAPQTFDLIVMNGVLEWVPYSRKNDNPRKAQIYYLRRLRELLKPDGVLYVGIENRTCYYQFMGGKDPHVELRGVAILPRFVSDIICKVKLGDRYRPYLYGHLGYKKLMQEAGFHGADVLAALPSYNDPRFLKNVERHSREFSDQIVASNKPFHRLMKSALIKLDLLKYLGYAYAVFAYNGGSRTSTPP